MSNDMFTDPMVEYLSRHQFCNAAADHGPNCPDLTTDQVTPEDEDSTQPEEKYVSNKFSQIEEALTSKIHEEGLEQAEEVQILHHQVRLALGPSVEEPKAVAVLHLAYAHLDGSETNVPEAVEALEIAARETLTLHGYFDVAEAERKHRDKEWAQQDQIIRDQDRVLTDVETVLRGLPEKASKKELLNTVARALRVLETH